MSKEKINNIMVLNDENVKSLNLMSNSINETITPVLENIKLMNKSLESVGRNNIYQKELCKSMKYFAAMGEQYNQAYQGIIDSFKPIINIISNIKLPKLNIDFNRWKIHTYRITFKEKEDIVNILYNHTIFPPIRYLIHNNINKKNIRNYEEWILDDKDLKVFYLDSITKWKNKYSDNNIKRMIDEIKFNLEYSNSYSVCTLIGVLIEYMLKQNYSEKIKSKGSIYSSIKNVLNEKVFHPIDIEKLYTRFIEENLYANTDSAKEFSRHITHGEKIEFGNMKSAMNMIFIYDFLQDVMIVNEN